MRGKGWGKRTKYIQKTGRRRTRLCQYFREDKTVGIGLGSDCYY
jgi:hypothetical protein